MILIVCLMVKSYFQDRIEDIKSRISETKLDDELGIIAEVEVEDNDEGMSITLIIYCENNELRIAAINYSKKPRQWKF